MITPRKILLGLVATICFLMIYQHSSSSTSIRTLRAQAAAAGSAAPNQALPTKQASISDNSNDKLANSADALPIAEQVKIPKQTPIQDGGKMTLHEKLAYQFPYDVEGKFPAYIWQTWKYTPASGDFGEEFRPAEASWSEKHPGFVHEVITDADALHLMRYLYAGVPEVLKAYEAMPVPILKADFFRYLILFARGGIYSDIDTHALKSAIDWIPPNVPHSTVGLVIGVEADPDRPDWANWYSRRIQFCQWTIQSKAGHPVLRDIVAKITTETLRRQRAGTLNEKDDNVVEWTGPAIWTDTIFDYFNNPQHYTILPGQGNITWEDFTGMKAPKKVGDTIVLPITSFSPGQKTMGSEEIDHPMAYVQHYFEGKSLGEWWADKMRESNAGL